MLGLFLVSVVCVTLTSGQGNLVYDGGSISSYHVRQVNQTYMRMHIIVLTGWKLGSGACGTHCEVREINYDTSPLKPGPGTNAVSLGKWTAEAGYGSTFKTTDITDYVKKHSVSYIIAQNKQDGWELDVTEFDMDVDMTADYTDITLSGPKWRPYDREGKLSTPESDLQIKLQPRIRNDTGLPNATPETIFKPVYRLPLNQVSFIHLAPVDPDGDAVICEPAAYVSAGGVRSPSNITIHKDCRIEVAAYESLGYTDNGWEAVALVMSDYNRGPITMGSKAVLKPYFRYLSQLSIQLMVHTVKTVPGPSFIDPTPVDQHMFDIEVNSLLNIHLAAKGNSAIKTYHVSTLPFANVNLTSETGDAGLIQWRPTHQDVGTYVMQVRATDVNGAETMERTYVVQVKDREPFALLPHLTDQDFAFVPTIADFQCRAQETCIIAVPVITNFKASSVTGGSGIDLVDWHGPHTSAPGTYRYQADVRIDKMSPGMHQQCVKLTSSSSSSVEKTVCVNVSVAYRDPCEEIPCMHYGECIATGDKFTCSCLATYTGNLCETVIDVCTPTPCVHGKCYNTFSGPNSFFCQCDPGFSGPKCDMGKPAGTTPDATTLPPIAVSSSTAGLCEDKQGVNCMLLNETTDICKSALGPKYCSHYCHTNC